MARRVGAGGGRRRAAREPARGARGLHHRADQRHPRRAHHQARRSCEAIVRARERPEAPTWWRSPATWSTAACATSPAHTAPLARPAVAPRHLHRHRQPRVLLRRRTRGSRELRRLGARVLLNEHVVLRARRRARSPWRASPTTRRITSIRRTAAIRARALRGRSRRRRARCCSRTSRARRRAAADAGYDLQLSGHTHGGQFWPWNLFVRLQQPFTAGLQPPRPHVGLHQPRHRLLGPADALRHSLGDHAHPPRSRVNQPTNRRFP